MGGPDGISFGSNQRYVDPDQFHTAVRGGNGLLSLLGRGEYAGELLTIQAGRLTLQRGRENLPRLSSSGMPPNRVGMLGWLNDDPLPIVRGRQMQRGDWIFLGDGMESYHRTAGPVDFAALTLDATDLAEAAIELMGAPLTIAPGTVLRMPEQLGAWLVSLIEAATRAIVTTPGIFASPYAAEALGQALLQPMIMCLSHGDVSGRASNGRRVAATKRFEAAVEANFGGALAIPDLSRSIGVSERMLRVLCREQLGISPVRFVALRRLHLARRALLRSDRHSASVTQIAMDHGIWEFGRFAATYKSLFGETPGTTLRRSPAT